MTYARIEELYQLCMNDAATAAEREEFIAWMALPENQQVARELVQRAMQSGVQLEPDAEVTDAIVQAILQADPLQEAQAPVRRLPASRKKYWIAAAAMIVVTAGTFFFSKQLSQPNTATLAKRDILPGKDGAILTLADGTQMVLDSMGNGVIATQHGTKVVLQNGQLAYDAATTGNAEAAYNTVSTPRGRQFRLLLPDGTKVWLNSASSITYPTSFSAQQRLVKVEGEAYFEVTTDRSKVFVVQARHAAVDVLGTSFNVNAYNDEQIVATTLLEGSVRAAVLTDNTISDGTVLQPGQQAQVAAVGASRVKVINNIETARVMAWKNGIFDFEDNNLASLMRQLARWYDIEVVFEKGVPDMEFGGKMSRNMKLSDVIKALKESGVDCSLEEGRKLVVHP